MSFWLCWSDRQPRTCFSDSSNSSNSARKTATWTRFDFSYLNQHKGKNDKSPFTIRPWQEDPVPPGLRFMRVCMWKPASHFLVLHCVFTLVSVCQQYHPNKVLIKSASRVSYALLTEKFPPRWQACPYIPSSLPPSVRPSQLSLPLSLPFLWFHLPLSYFLFK